MKSKNKGITLVPLIITIVVLLILATLTIKGISGEEIVDKAQETKEGVINLQTEEEIRFAVLKLQNIEETVEDKVHWLSNELPGAVVTEGIKSVIIKYKGVIVSLNNDYQIQDFYETEDEILEIQIEEQIQSALLNLENIGETVEDKVQWLREELQATVSEGEDRILISYRGYKIVLDSNYTIQEMFTTGEWDSTATPEEVFRWGSNDPLSPDYGTVTGYNAIAKNYTTLKYPSRCTKIMDCYSSGGSTGYVANIEKVEIPSTVVSFGNYAFGRSTSHVVFNNLKEVVIEKGVTRLGSSMFYGASELETVILPDGIKSIPSAAFRDCAKLSQIDIPNSVTNIESYAFGGCTSLTELIIPDSVTNIGYMAFLNCTSIESIVIPKSVVEMAAQPFRNWTSTQKVYVYFDSYSQKPAGWNNQWATNGAQKEYSMNTGEELK